MGHVIRTDAETYRANWRDPTGRQRSKTFPTKKAAAAFLAETEAAANRGQYVDPHAGRARFGPYAHRWLDSRHLERTTIARDTSLMRTHILSRWEGSPMDRIDHLAVQAWVTDLAAIRAPATVIKCFRLFRAVLTAAVRDRIIGVNPCEGVSLPGVRRKDTDGKTITPQTLTEELLPALPDRYRALVALSGGTGLRWGECVGLRWDAVDLDTGHLQVLRVATEVAGNVAYKPFPKSRAGRRDVPLPAFVRTELRTHRTNHLPGPNGEIFTNSTGGPLRRTLFRSRVWRPALVRAGLLGHIQPTGRDTWRANWTTPEGHRTGEFPTEKDAVTQIARSNAEGLRFHDLRHSYATWLISNGVPINDVQRVMGHENPSTTLNMYTHKSSDPNTRVLAAFTTPAHA